MTSRTVNIVVTENEAGQLLQICAQAPLPYNVSHPLITKISKAMQPVTRSATQDTPDASPEVVEGGGAGFPQRVNLQDIADDELNAEIVRRDGGKREHVD